MSHPAVMTKLGGKNGEKSKGLLKGHWPEGLTQSTPFQVLPKDEYSVAVPRYPSSGDMWLPRKVFKSLLTKLFTTGAHTSHGSLDLSTEICLAGNRGQNNYEIKNLLREKTLCTFITLFCLVKSCAYQRNQNFGFPTLCIIETGNVQLPGTSEPPPSPCPARLSGLIPARAKTVIY